MRPPLSVSESMMYGPSPGDPATPFSSRGDVAPWDSRPNAWLDEAVIASSHCIISEDRKIAWESFQV
jgi:hypothetical protein